MVVCGYEMQRGKCREGSDVFTMNEVDFGLHMSSVVEVLLGVWGICVRTVLRYSTIQNTIGTAMTKRSRAREGTFGLRS